MHGSESLHLHGISLEGHKTKNKTKKTKQIGISGASGETKKLQARSRRETSLSPYPKDRMGKKRS